ncbi:MAG: cytochrome c biogenesis protein ResB [Chlorobiales bacterium]|nr:cytochrome c biogenesis protein ResB [Chlorobiales bacterium]
MQKQQKKSFEARRGYKEGALTACILVAAGWIIELASGGEGVAVPGWPVNGILFVILVVIVFLVGILLRKHELVAWLGGIPLGLSLISALAGLSIVGGILPQDPEYGSGLLSDIGLNRVFASWPFALVCTLFLLNLGFGFVKKLVPFKVSNIQFLLFHAGFWVAVTGALLGSADLQRLAIPLYEGQESKKGYDRVLDSMVEMPFSVYLHDFAIEEYAPILGLYDPVQEKFLPNASRTMLEVSPGLHVSWGDIEVEVLEAMPHGVVQGGGDPVPSDSASGVPFAKVRVRHGEKEQTGWINPQGPGIESSYLVVEQFALVLLTGTPRKFSSEVMFIDNGGNKAIATLEVNKPFEFAGWKIYQAGYDEKAGKWSTLSVAEGVKDPWLPVVYLGFYLIMAGNLMFFWQGMKKSSKK